MRGGRYENSFIWTLDFDENGEGVIMPKLSSVQIVKLINPKYRHGEIPSDDVKDKWQYIYCSNNHAISVIRIVDYDREGNDCFEIFQRNVSGFKSTKLFDGVKRYKSYSDAQDMAYYYLRPSYRAKAWLRSKLRKLK